MKTTLGTVVEDRAATQPPARPDDPRRRLDWRRLRSPWTWVALAALAVASVATAAGSVVAGRLAESPTSTGVTVLAVLLLGGSVVETVGKYLWVTLCDRAEGRLRDDLLDAALAQPLPVLGEQAVGEIMDRVDDDSHEVGTFLRWHVWFLGRTVLGAVPLWIVAGVTWWPAWLLFPALAWLTFVVVRPLLGQISRRKVEEEMAWTDHAAALEEGVAGRDDLRTSLGQAHVVARLARLSAVVHARYRRVLTMEAQMVRRAGLVLYVLLAAVALTGVWLALADRLDVAGLVTLFLVTSAFVGQATRLASQLADLQEGFGAVLRLRQLLEVVPEPEGGRPVPDADLDIEVRHLDFSYEEGSFALRDVDLLVPAGETLALVGRTGSGKSTLASLLSRAVDPPRGTVLLGGVDVLDIDLQELRAAIGVVTQRTEILAGTLADNMTLFADVPRERVEAAVAELGLSDWVAGLGDGLDTLLGPGGLTLSAGEEQLVAFARLLLREVKVVVLDEATARMDPLTEQRVVAAAERLLAGRTGILIAHRLTTVGRAALVAVLDSGRVVQQGRRVDLVAQAGPFGELWRASLGDHDGSEAAPRTGSQDDAVDGVGQVVGATRRTGPPPQSTPVGTGPSLAKGILRVLTVRPAWGLVGAVLFLSESMVGAQGAVTGLVWGEVVEGLEGGQRPTALLVVLVAALLAAPVLLAGAFMRYLPWWVEVLLRVRMSVLVGQTAQRRLPRTPPGEVVARAMDAERYARYADRWVDFVNGLLLAGFTALLAGTWLAGAVLLTVLVAAALASALGRPVAGRSAAAASTARAGFGRALVSALECVRTVKLAAAVPAVRAHLRVVDSGRVAAAVREHRVAAVLDGVPVVMVQAGVVAAWAIHLDGGWGLATTLLVANAVAGFDWFGRVAGLVVTEAPGTRAWQKETSWLAGGVDLMTLPAGVDLSTGEAPRPPEVARTPLEHLRLRDVTAVHDDGTIGVRGVDLDVGRGELVLLVGQVGAGKSSLLAALAGLIDHRGEITWNGRRVDDPELFLRPGQVAHVAQVPRVLSGTFGDNVRLGHERSFRAPVEVARLEPDVAAAGGRDALVGHRGVRLSGGQVQRLALARALATRAELLVADDVSSALDATTEVDLWKGLRARGSTVVGATSKRAALALADRVVVLVDGEVAAVGPWRDLAPRWGHLAG